MGGKPLPQSYRMKKIRESCDFSLLKVVTSFSCCVLRQSSSLLCASLHLFVSETLANRAGNVHAKTVEGLYVPRGVKMNRSRDQGIKYKADCTPIRIHLSRPHAYS